MGWIILPVAGQFLTITTRLQLQLASIEWALELTFVSFSEF